MSDQPELHLPPVPANDILRENAKLRAALEEAHAFINEVGTEDPEDVETMACIEQLSGRIAAALGGAAK